MDNIYAKTTEKAKREIMVGISEKEFLEAVRYNGNGLVPAIAQDEDTKDVLMLAYMNEEALKLSIATSFATYYSRSRRALWKKGETSGHYQHIVSIAVDCDGDCILMKVKQTEVACHTGKFTCFYRKLDNTINTTVPTKKEPDTALTQKIETQRILSISEPPASYNATHNSKSPIISEPADTYDTSSVSEPTASYNASQNGNSSMISEPAATYNTSMTDVLKDLLYVITDRRNNPREGSYTSSLFLKGMDKIAKKVGEEAAEVIIAAKNNSRKEITYEASDLIYHLMVLLVESGVHIDDIYNELKNRR